MQRNNLPKSSFQEPKITPAGLSTRIYYYTIYRYCDYIVIKYYLYKITYLFNKACRMKGYILTQCFIPNLQINFWQFRHFRVVTVALYKAVLSLYI